MDSIARDSGKGTAFDAGVRRVPLMASWLQLLAGAPENGHRRRFVI
jgi:hypothetical protein